MFSVVLKRELLSYIDLSALIQDEIQILDLESHGLKLGSGEVLKGGMGVVSRYCELDWASSTTCGGQYVTASPLKVICQTVKGDVVWITVHTAGGGFEKEAAFDPIFNLTNFIVCTLHLSALHIVITHTLTLLHTISFHQCFSFLQAEQSYVNKLLWNWICE